MLRLRRGFRFCVYLNLRSMGFHMVGSDSNIRSHKSEIICSTCPFSSIIERFFLCFWDALYVFSSFANMQLLNAMLLLCAIIWNQLSYRAYMVSSSSLSFYSIFLWLETRLIMIKYRNIGKGQIHIITLLSINNRHRHWGSFMWPILI